MLQKYNLHTKNIKKAILKDSLIVSRTSILFITLQTNSTNQPNKCKKLKVNVTFQLFRHLLLK
jgi:hypothetical protein